MMSFDLRIVLVSYAKPFVVVMFIYYKQVKAKR
jgi:hypothetical protein